METIFDHNVTEKELTRFGGKEFFDKAEKYGINVFENEDDANYHIGLLYSMRGDKEKAQIYFDRIKNRELLTLLWQDYP